MQQAQYLEPSMTGLPVDEDVRLVRRIAAGDRDALTALYERYQRTLFRYLVQLTSDHGLAEEVLQDTIVAVWKGARRFEERSRVQTWLIGIARRQAYGRLRRPSVALVGLDATADVASEEPDPESHVLVQADRESVVEALGRISSIHREVLDLCFSQGLSYQEISEVVGIPIGTVKSRLNHAKRALREQLEGHRGTNDESND